MAAEEVLTRPDRLSTLEERIEDLTIAIDELCDQVKLLNEAISRLKGLSGLGSVLGNILRPQAAPAPRVRRR